MGTTHESETRQPARRVMHVSVMPRGMIPNMVAKVGRKSKGDRDAFALRPLRPLGDRIRANADALGMSYNDYVIGIMADAVGMPEYAPTRIEAAGQLDLSIDRMTA